MSEIEYHYPMFARLEPRTEWRGGRMADTDVLTLEDAARFASKHSGEEVTPGDVLRAAARREISLHAIVHRAAKVHAHDGGVYCNKGEATENLVPAGSIPTLPLSACQSLAATGRASWRTFDGVKSIDGEIVYFTKALLDEGEPNFETVPADCRVTGHAAHALADAYCAPEEPPQAEAPQPLVHRIRADMLVAPIRKAQNQVENPGDVHSVFAILRTMAKDKNPPFIGSTEEGLQWLDSQENLKILSVGALRKRLARNTKNAR